MFTCILFSVHYNALTCLYFCKLVFSGPICNLCSLVLSVSVSTFVLFSKEAIPDSIFVTVAMDSDFEVEDLFGEEGVSSCFALALKRVLVSVAELMTEPLFAELNKSTESFGSLSQVRIVILSELCII